MTLYSKFLAGCWVVVIGIGVSGCAITQDHQQGCTGEAIQAQMFARSALNGISVQDAFNTTHPVARMGMGVGEFWGLGLDVYKFIGDERAPVRGDYAGGGHYQGYVNGDYYSVQVGPIRVGSFGEVEKHRAWVDKTGAYIKQQCETKGPAMTRYKI